MTRSNHWRDPGSPPLSELELVDPPAAAFSRRDLVIMRARAALAVA